jgi:quinol monooxygenase YgiN
MISHVQLIAEFQCKPEAIQQIEGLVVEFVEQTRAEPGCEKVYSYLCNEDPERYVFFAEFVDDEALEQHLNEAWRDGLFALAPRLLVDAPRRFTMRRVA